MPSSRSFQSTAASRSPIVFDVDGEEFTAIPAMPATASLALVALTEAGSNAEKAQATLGILDELLLPESAERFAARMRGGAHPISLEDALAVVGWLLPEVSGRPTVGASPSQPGSSTPGPSSTDGAPPEGSTPEPSPSPGS